MPDADTEDPTRLSVNINQHTAALLRQYMERHGTTATETVRRLVGYGSVVDDAWENGEDVLVRRSGWLVETYSKLERPS